MRLHYPISVAISPRRAIPLVVAMSTRMHQTTVRFAADLWHELEAEAALLGVSAAQYVRDATLARLAFTAGQRSASSALTERRTEAGDRAPSARSESDAVWAQARLARERARSVREQAHAVQAEMRQGLRGRARIKAAR